MKKLEDFRRPADRLSPLSTGKVHLPGGSGLHGRYPGIL